MNLTDLHVIGITARAEGDRIALDGPDDVLTDELLRRIGASKTALLVELAGATRPSPNPNPHFVTKAGERCAHVLDQFDAAGCLLWIGYDGALCWPANIAPELRRLVIDYRQDLHIEVSARGVYADEWEAFEERAAVIAQDGEVTREDAERQALTWVVNDAHERGRYRSGE